MGIEFHCTHCNKLIRAPGEAGGKRGKCPYCKQSVYIPTPPEELEEIPVAPLDDAGERHRRQLDEEMRRMQQALQKEDQEPAEGAQAPPIGAGAAMPLPAVGAAGLEALIVDYVRAMQESRLEVAEGIARQVQNQAKPARKLLQQWLMDEIPPAELQNVPPALFQGFLRTLLERI